MKDYIYINSKLLELPLTSRQLQLLMFCLLSMDKEGVFHLSFNQIAMMTGLSTNYVEEDLKNLGGFVSFSDTTDKYGRREFKVRNYESFCKLED